jgi:hypothetical protein
MATGFGSLAEVTWTEAERRYAVVMILTRRGDILTDSEIADLTCVDCRRVNQLRRDPRQVFPVHQEPRWPPGRSGRPPHIFETGLWVNTDIVLWCGCKTRPAAMSPTGPSSNSRTTGPGRPGLEGLLASQQSWS